MGSSQLAAIFAIYSLGNDIGYFDTVNNQKAWIYIALVVFAVACSIIPLIMDAVLNIQKEKEEKEEKAASINKKNGEEEDDEI